MEAFQNTCLKRKLLVAWLNKHLINKNAKREICSNSATANYKVGKLMSSPTTHRSISVQHPFPRVLYSRVADFLNDFIIFFETCFSLKSLTLRT